MGRVDEAWVARPARGDVSGIFGLIAVGPLLLPRLGVRMEAIAFGVPLVLAIFAAVEWWRAAGRDRARRAAWLTLAAGMAVGAVASGIGVVLTAVSSSARWGLYVGLGATLCLLAGASLLVRADRHRLRVDRLVDAVVPAIAIAALAGWFAIVPGLRDGDPVLATVLFADVLAVFLALVALVAQQDGDRSAVRWLVLGLLALVVADAVAAAGAAGRLAELPVVVALLWGAASMAIAVAGDRIARPASTDRSRRRRTGEAWAHVRVVAPVMSVLAVPAGLGVVALTGEVTPPAVAWFSVWFVVGLVLAMGRQAHLIVDHRRGMARERELHRAMARRNEELEALTGLATTMTETLEEAPILERGLDALRLAARASSSALHVCDGEGLRLRAAAGRWADDHVWAKAPGSAPTAGGGEHSIAERGGRTILRMSLHARGDVLGLVTLVRPATQPFADREVELLRLLADQVAIALQNARDYREKLDQAVRDPLTGLYNRRFFYEALTNEVRRHDRYGSRAALVLLDVDRFKSINDELGHQVGDEVLRGIGRLVTGLIRPVDSFARIGGEEFALLLPETGQLDALLAAERVRTAISRHPLLDGVRVTVSGGVAALPDDATDVEELVRRADGALYWAKRNGRNLCAVASEVLVDDETAPGVSATPFHAIVAALDAAEFSTRDHSENVAVYAVAIAERLGFRGERLSRLRQAALFHDIGKLAVDARILAKPGRLTDTERAAIERHAEAGATMLAHGGLDEEARWVRHHHERIDGEGYPARLAGDDIPLESRIIFVADSFEAMTSDRPYRQGMAVEQALEEVRRHAGTQFDQRVADVLVELVSTRQLPLLAVRA